MAELPAQVTLTCATVNPDKHTARCARLPGWVMLANKLEVQPSHFKIAHLLCRRSTDQCMPYHGLQEFWQAGPKLLAGRSNTPRTKNMQQAYNQVLRAITQFQCYSDAAVQNRLQDAHRKACWVGLHCCVGGPGNCGDRCTCATTYKQRHMHHAKYIQQIQRFELQ
jgi:hypothetical protein